jgi:acyl-CoA hydrolase
MSHNVYQHIESVQRANALTDMVSATVDTNYKHWRKLKNNSKEEQFSPYVPRNIIYMTQFIEQLFKSETPMQMLDEAGPMLANFNGQKSLTSSTDSFNSLFEVEDQFINETEEMTPEQEEAAEEFLETLEV